MIARANQFMDTLKKAKVEVGFAAGSKPDAPPKASPTTLEDALDAAQSCTKCRPRKDGMKGCKECMGEFFDAIRAR